MHYYAISIDVSMYEAYNVRAIYIEHGCVDRRNSYDKHVCEK